MPAIVICHASSLGDTAVRVPPTVRTLRTLPALLLVAILFPAGAQPAFAQRMTLPGAGVGGASGGGAVGTIQLPSQTPSLKLDLGVSLLPSQSPSPPASQEPPSVVAPAETPAETAAIPLTAPLFRAPLMSAVARTANGGQCEMTDAERTPCSGPDCLLSCAAGGCGEQESTSCEFVLDCATELTAELASGDHQCEDSSIKIGMFDTQGGEVKVEIVRLPTGTSCKPPPCVR